jgi:hypothetical protein
MRLFCAVLEFLKRWQHCERLFQGVGGIEDYENEAELVAELGSEFVLTLGCAEEDPSESCIFIGFLVVLTSTSTICSRWRGRVDSSIGSDACIRLIASRLFCP